MDEKIIKIVAAKLRRIGDQPINADKLTEIREEVYKATRTNKFASFSNVKKWVKAARGYMKAQEKAKPAAAKGGAHSPKANRAAKAKPSKGASRPAKHEEEFVAPVVPRRIEDSVNFIKEENAPAMPSQEVVLPKPTIVIDKVYLQSIKFEIAGIRQTMERVSRQLDKLEKELTNHSD